MMTPATEKSLRDRLHEAVDRLPEDELHSALRYVEYLRDDADPLLRALDEAPEDDEPLTEEDIRAIAESRAEYARGECRTWDEARKDLGLE
jgi:hypothetical protein